MPETPTERLLLEPVWDETNVPTAFKPGNRRGSSGRRSPKCPRSLRRPLPSAAATFS